MADFNLSETKKNLMKALAGESMARNRYTFAAEVCREQSLYVLSAVFNYTADQEKEHAEIFYEHLNSFSGSEINVNGDYPIDATNDVIKLLRYAEQHEKAEHDPIYKSFAETAQSEGFASVGSSFKMIAEIEKTHAERFSMLADMLENGTLFVSSAITEWACLNCGHVQSSLAAPDKCPVCKHDKGFFIRLELAPFAK